MTQNIIKKSLEQYDFADGEYLEASIDKYSSLIGEFVIRYSELEHDLNIKIVETFFDDDHTNGYRVIKNLGFADKINLFYDIFLERIMNTKEASKIDLDKLKQNLIEISNFRNLLIHANWVSLTKKGFVRTKIETDKSDGAIRFCNVKIIPKDINNNIKKINLIKDNLLEFCEEST